ncbi:DUF1565 domain-containing protein, partial [Chitinophagaceae bacterium LB-8]
MKMKIERFIVFFFLLTCISASAQNKATVTKSQYKEYHVSVNGSDSNDGSLASPLKTITAASNLAMPGDLVTVHAGI